MSYIKRFLRLYAGLFLYGAAIYMMIQANLGLSPWETLSAGLALLTGMSFGDMTVLSGLVILIIDIYLKEPIGFGTFFNTILIGKSVDLIAWFDPLPKLDSYALGIPLLLVSQVVAVFAIYLYISAGLGCGPRDSLMVGIGKRLSKTPIGIVRSGLEGTVLLVGWLLGAKVGLGTIVSVFGIGIIMEYFFRLLRFDVRAVEHETFADTIKIWRGGTKKPAEELR